MNISASTANMPKRLSFYGSVQLAAMEKSKKVLSPKGREKAAAEGGFFMSKKIVVLFGVLGGLVITGLIIALVVVSTKLSDKSEVLAYRSEQVAQLNSEVFALVETKQEEVWKSEKIQRALVRALVLASRDAKPGGYVIGTKDAYSEITIDWEEGLENGRARTVHVRTECGENFSLCDWIDRSPVEATFLVDD